MLLHYYSNLNSELTKLTSKKFSIKNSSLFFKQIFSSSEECDSVLEEGREMWFESQICGGKGWIENLQQSIWSNR